MAGRRDIYEMALRQGGSAAWDQKWDQAIGLYQKALAEFPGDPVAMDHLALAYMQNGQQDQAQGIYQDFIRADPKNPIPHEKIGEILEQRGRINEAVQLRMSAAELYLEQREANKAIDNWLAAARLAPENMMVRSKLALVFERTGQTRQAVTEYLALAAILQRARQTEKALQAIEQGIRILPDAPELTRARQALKSGKVLAIPPPYKPGMTGILTPPADFPPLPPAKPATPAPEIRSNNPLEAAQKKALSLLAERLFEGDKESGDQKRVSLDEFSKRKDKESNTQSEQNRYLALGIDTYSRDRFEDALQNFETALKVGLDVPSIHLLIGALLIKQGKLHEAIGPLQRVVNHSELAAGSYYALGKIFREEREYHKSAIHFLSALRLADLATVSTEQRDYLQRQYETFLEVPEAEQEADQWNETGKRIEALLTSPEWEGRIKLARAQLDAQSDSPGTTPLAEMLSLGKPQALIEAMGHLENAFRRGMLRTAMEQAMLALDHGPTYLPLHQRIAEIQLREDRQDEAIAKMVIIARAYRLRGEGLQASRTLERVLQLNPMDISSRNDLIQLKVQQGDLRGALSLYLDLADVYFQLADLEGARQTYESALMLAVQNKADKAWQIQLLYRLGDLYMQRLDFRAALQTFQRIQQLDPSDEKACGQLVDLMLRLGKTNDARLIIDGLAAEHARTGRQDQTLVWMEDLVRQRPEDATLRRKLAELYQQRGRIAEAIAQLDALGDAQVEAGEMREAVVTIQMILALNPPNAASYRQILQRLETGAIR